MSIITPPQSGFPDYVRSLTWDYGLFVNYAGTPQPAQFLGPFYCVPWRAVLLNFRNISPGATEGARLALEWSSDRNGNVGFVRRDMATYGNPAQWEGLVLANCGTWLNVTLQSETVTAPNIGLTVQPTNRVPDSTGTLVDTQAGVFYNEGIGAGFSQSFAPPHMFCGPGIVSVISTQGATWTFDTVDDNGLGFNSFPLPDLAGGVQQTFNWNFPLTQWRFTVNNTSAAATTINLMAQPENRAA